MSLQNLLSFDKISTLSTLPRYISVAGTWLVEASSGRRSGGCARTNSTEQKMYFAVDGHATIGFQAAVAFLAAPAATRELIFFQETGGTTHVSLCVNTDGSLTVKRGEVAGTTLGSTASGVVTFSGTFYYIELLVVIDNSAGAITLEVNGASVLTLTSQDTRNGGTSGVCNSVGICGIQNTGTRWDDLILFDGNDTGDGWTTLHGDRRIDAHLVDGNGNSSQWTRSTGADQYATVDDSTPNDDTDYNETTTAGNKDTMTLAALAAAGYNPDAVQVDLYCRKTEAGECSVCTVLRISGAETDGTTTHLSQTYAYQVSQRYGEQPSTAAWTEAVFNAMEVGYKKVS